MSNILRDKRVQFICVFALIFSLIPTLFRNVIPYDMIENLYWGKELQLGYAKHPPLFAWVSFAFFKIFGSIPESLYFLTQLNLLVGCCFIYKISRLLNHDKSTSISSVLFLLASVATTFGNTKLNATTILFSLLPAIYFFFLRMMKFQKISDAVFLGIFAMLACIGKYIALMFLGCIGLFLICDNQARKLMKMLLPYIAVFAFLIAISWHINWMYQSDFISLKYGLEKSVSAVSNRWSAVNFILMIILFFGTSTLALFYSSKTHDVINHCVSKYRFCYSSEERFVIMITVAPIIILFIMSLTTGMNIGSFWGASLCPLIGVYFNILNQDVNHERLFKFTKISTLIFAIIMTLQLSVGRNYWKHHDASEAINATKLVYCIENDCYNRFGEKHISFIHADKATAFLHAYLHDSPKFYDANKFNQLQIFDNYEIKGIHLVTFLCHKDDNKISEFIDKYNELIEISGLVHIIDDFYVYYAFIDIEEKHNEKD